MRKFEKISFEQFKKDIADDKDLYESYSLPIRKTTRAASYDFLAIKDIIINPGEIKKIPTGIKADMYEDDMLMLCVRSSMGFKYNVRLCNQVGIIDADYYNNPDNEGHMWLALQNEGDKVFSVKAGEGFGQGIFIKYLTVDDEEKVESVRTGGFGSTNKED